MTLGSLLATGLWLLTSFGFRWYLQNVFNFAVLYGALGSAVVRDAVALSFGPGDPHWGGVECRDRSGAPEEGFGGAEAG